MQSTNSPRPLFPKMTVQQNLQLITKNEDIDQQLDTTQQTPKSYMFSKLLQDLDELSELQTPFVEKQLEEISETLSEISNPLEDDQEPEMEFGLTFPWSVKKEEVIEHSHSESESEDSGEECMEHVSW